MDISEIVIIALVAVLLIIKISKSDKKLVNPAMEQQPPSPFDDNFFPTSKDKLPPENVHASATVKRKKKPEPFINERPQDEGQRATSDILLSQQAENEDSTEEFDWKKAIITHEILKRKF